MRGEEALAFATSAALAELALGSAGSAFGLATSAFLRDAAERTDALFAAGAFLVAALERLFDRGLATEPLIAFEDFAMVQPARSRLGRATTERSLPLF